MILSIPIVITLKILVINSTYDDKIRNSIVNFIENNIFDPPEAADDSDKVGIPLSFSLSL